MKSLAYNSWREPLKAIENKAEIFICLWDIKVSFISSNQYKLLWTGNSQSTYLSVRNKWMQHV